KRRKIAKDADKTSLVFSLRNVPGALFKALSVFALRDLDLSKIQSRPVRGRPWEYSFFVDVRRGDDPAMRLALRHLEEVAGFVKVLGVYRGARQRGCAPKDYPSVICSPSNPLFTICSLQKRWRLHLTLYHGHQI